MTAVMNPLKSPWMRTRSGLDVTEGSFVGRVNAEVVGEVVAAEGGAGPEAVVEVVVSECVQPSLQEVALNADVAGLAARNECSA